MDWSSLPSLSALRAFEAAARHQSLSRAARELNVTHAAIAQHVRHLEADLSEQLLFRAGRGVAATEAGQKLAQKLGEGFALIAEGVDALREQSATRPLTVSLTPSFAMNWLMPRMGGFWQTHPDITVSLTPSAALVDLRHDGFDMAIRFGNGEWPGLESTPLTSGEFWVVAAPNFLEGRHPTSLPELQQDPWLLDAQMLELRRVIEETGFDLSAVNLNVLDSNELIISATLAGLGVSVHPRSIVERDVTAGTLIHICSLPRADLGYHIVTLPGRDSANLRTFRKWLLNVASEPTG
ncbi:LysR family transcriptional regulator [Shimia sp. R10_1]|uniref:LysR substrate-binding domain-containing protein n=1 Tax=Shimia sp. R10_1 TaxID=2821095 RepID=UPI001ADA2344|nr:LysR substrate-binding domain-containing protein [Shimia sp. R10_1]MBO9474322.1 LysR family transcriptional regulator [Shimia sp. R10_1]